MAEFNTASIELPDIVDDSVWINGEEHQIAKKDQQENGLTIVLADPITIRTEEGEAVMNLEVLDLSLH